MAMRGSQMAHRAWDSLGNGALFTNRIRWPLRIEAMCRLNSPTSPSQISRPIQIRCQSTLQTSWTPRRSIAISKHLPSGSSFQPHRILQTSHRPQQQAAVPTQTQTQTPVRQDEEKSYRDTAQAVSDPAEYDPDDIDTFKRSDKANRASEINLSAKLSTEGPDGEGNAAGSWREVYRLLSIARPELKTLSIAFGFLLISSSVTMTVPFSIGRIMDAASSNQGTMFGFPMEQFYLGLGTLLACGACANYGRIVLLRIVGERVVTKLRSQLFKRTFIQNAEFFDANRVGDLISRLGSDTIIVGKSITQNVSDGLRSLVSAAAGLTMMGYVSIKLTGVLAIFLPPVALGAFFYGRAIRNLSRRIQKNLGTLTKIAEERLGNVRTSQAFAGELQEVHRYNTQTRKIFSLGRKEAFISATFFSASGFMGNMTFIALLYVGGGMVKSGLISIGDLTSFLM